MDSRDNMDEVFPLVDENGNLVGSATRAECHSGSRLLHPVVHLHVFNSAGELFLQKRPLWKDVQPGKWDTAVGGHFALGENAQAALRREASEEIGITDFEPEFVTAYVYDSVTERELVFVYRTVYDSAISPGDELDDGRFWTRADIIDNLGKGIFTPNFEMEIEKAGLL